MIDLKKNTVAEWMLKEGYTEVTPMDFYRDIYPEEVLRADNKGSAKDEGMGRVQIVVHSTKKVMGSNEKGYAKPFFKDLSGLKMAIDKSNETYGLLEAAGDKNFSVLCMLNPCTYYGKKTEAVYMYEVLALVVEIDSILGTEAAGDPPDRQDFRGLSNMFKQMRSVYIARTNTVREPLLPSPTYITCSGHGEHLYYLFDEPVRVNRAFILEQYNTLNSYKLALMRCIWNESSMITKKKLELQSINQRYRTVGTPTKNGSVCRAFRFGDKVSVDYMNSFCKRLKYTDPDTKQLVCAPEIYRLKPKTGGPTGKTIKYQKTYPRYGTMHRGAYDKALERIKYFAKEGLRYRMLYCLAATDRMCSISEDELKQDAYNLLDFLDSKTESPDNRFTSYDIQETVFDDLETRVAAIDEQLAELQQQLVDNSGDSALVDELGVQIDDLLGDRQDILAEAAERTDLQARMNDMISFLEEMPVAVTEYSEVLARRLVERITIFDEKIVVELKSGLKMEVEE